VTSAEELRAAATLLRKALPGDLIATPRLVMSEAETISGIAFCVDHRLPLDDEHEYAACDHCEVIDCKYERLAAIVLALLLSREPLADWLEADARFIRNVAPEPELAEKHFGAALATARVITGGTP
jgi:hypothetical protein